MEEGTGGRGRKKVGKEEWRKRKEEERKGREGGRRRGIKEEEEEQTGRDASARGQKGTLKCHTRSHLKVSERNFKSKSMISQRNPAPTRPYLVQT